MSEINLPPFYVGQKVVQLVDGSITMSKKGDVFTVISIFKNTCGCWWIHIGHSSSKDRIQCHIHPGDTTATHGIKWIHSKFFAPVAENFQSITLEKVLEEETRLISVN